jgi:hypothetical protein
MSIKELRENLIWAALCEAKAGILSELCVHENARHSVSFVACDLWKEAWNSCANDVCVCELDIIWWYHFQIDCNILFFHFIIITQPRMSNLFRPWENKLIFASSRERDESCGLDENLHSKSMKNYFCGDKPSDLKRSNRNPSFLMHTQKRENEWNNGNRKNVLTRFHSIH